MKTAISMPDPLFEELEQAAQRLRMSRSAVVSRALRELFARLPPAEDTTMAYDRALAEAREAGWDETAELEFLREAAASRDRHLRSGE